MQLVEAGGQPMKSACSGRDLSAIYLIMEGREEKVSKSKLLGIVDIRMTWNVNAAIL